MIYPLHFYQNFSLQNNRFITLPFSLNAPKCLKSKLKALLTQSNYLTTTRLQLVKACAFTFRFHFSAACLINNALLVIEDQTTLRMLPFDRNS